MLVYILKNFVGDLKLKYYCIGHKPPTFLHSESYIHVSPNVFPGLNQLIVPDDLYGDKFHGSVLSEYAQLFGLAEFLKNVSISEKFYIFQYRKFISLQPGHQRSTNVPYVFSSSPEEGSRLFPSKDELSRHSEKLLFGPAVYIRSMAHQYSLNHHVEDFSRFILSLNSLDGFDEKRCDNFINCELLIPAPSLGVTCTDIFLKHMAILKLAWEHFSNHFSTSRDGYQRRVGGFLLERLHSFLLYEEINIKKKYSVFQGHQIVISDSQIIKPTI